MVQLIRRALAAAAIAAIALFVPGVVSAQSVDSPAGAGRWPQEAGTFEQLQMLVRPGEMVTVGDASGAQTRGRIVGLSATSLQLGAEGAPRTFSVADVREVRTRRSDSLSNGAKIGAITGGIFGGIGAAIICATEDCPAWLLATVGAYVMMGTGVGVGIDALIVRERTVFRAPGTPARRLTVTPVVDRQRRGFAVRLSF